MKKNIYVVLISSLISLLSFADTEKVGSYTWTYRINGNGVEIYNNGTAISPKPTGAVTIPSTLGGKSVTGIGSGAFSDCSGLTSLTIPNSVTNIDACAFLRCSSLEEFIVRSGNTNFKGDGEWLLSKDGRTIISAPCGTRNTSIPTGVTRIGSYAFCYNKISSIQIPATVTTIDDHAFAECTNLKNVTIPNSVTSIGAWAFTWCALTSISIPASVLSIGNGAFSDCDLKSVTINEGVTSIGDAAFLSNRQLISVTIPNSVKSIGKQAFRNCINLTSVSIPDSVTYIGEESFHGCGIISMRIPFVPDVGGYNSDACEYVSGLSYFFGYRGTDNHYYYSNVPATLKTVIIGSMDNITDYSFYNCSNLTSITISSGVKNIGSCAFDGCKKLTGIIIPNSVTNIGSYAFYGCEKITEMTIPNSVTNIGAGAFSRCYGMTSVTIGSGVRRIGSSAFNYCNSLTAVHIRDLASWCNINFTSGDSNPLCYAENLYLNGSLVRDLTIPEEVINIGNYAFHGCDGLTSVTIPEGVTSIGCDAFSSCSGLTSVVFGGNAPSVGDSAFGYVNSSCVAYVPHFSTGWGVEIPGRWNGIAIQYYPWVKVRFNLGGHAVRTGGGALEQEVLYQSAVVAPEFKTDYGWLFRGWDADLSCMQSNMTVNALWNTAFESGENAQWTWQTGTTWKSGSIGNDSSSWLGLSVNGSGRLSFKWKTSSEEYYGDVFDYVYLSVDGEAKGGLNDYKTQGVALGGKTEWQDVVVDIAGDGPHDIKWIFIKDEVDESDCGEDCAWVSNVSFSPLVSVTFGLNGGEGIIPDSITALANTHTNLPMATQFHREDYVFAGWSDGARTYQSGAAYTLPAEDVVMTAQWLPKTFVSFSLNGGVGNVPATIKQLPETIVILPSSDGFNREGFAFAGWSDGSAVHQSGAQYVVPSNNVTLCAQWIEKKTISYSIGEATGAVPLPQTDVPGVKVTLPSDEGFNRAKYSFVGWSDGSATFVSGYEYVIPDDDVEMTAVWRANELAVPVIASANVANGGTTESAYVDVTISAESGTLIYYTTDGTAPTAESIRYDGTFRITAQRVTIKAIAARDNFFDSDIASFTFTRKPFSVEECIDVDVAVESGGNAAWVRDLTTTHDGEASMRSGNIGDGESSWIEMYVTGCGQVGFWWKVSSEISRNRKMDYVSFEIDGNEMSWLGGDKDWTNEVYSITSRGDHVLKWTYQKNDNGATQGMDCAWLDEVTWTPVDPLPEVASDSDVTNALMGAADEARLRAHLSDKAKYDQFRAWVNAKGLDHETVKNSARAWFSYAIGANGLVEKAFLNDDVTIGSPTPTSDGGLSFEVNVRDALIGEGATPANLESVFRVQGAYSLRENAFSSKNVVSEIRASANGSMAVTVRPNHATDAFFARMCMYADGEPGPEPDEELLPTCTVTFDANGGVGGTTVSVTQRNALETLPTPTCEGYEFKGWFTALSGGTQVTASTIVMADVTYYAHWTRGKVQLWNGGPYWATMNIGAEKSEDYGLHFWWGDTVGYRRENNAWVASDGSTSDFSFSPGNVPNYGKNKASLQSEGWITADGVLAPEHDAAHVQWGGDWRMPMEQELFDLNSNCDWTWTTKKGVSGYIVRGRGDYATSSIFLPAAGYGLGTSLECVAAGGYYWFSVPNCELYCNCVEHRKNVIDSNFGFTVRPVQDVVDVDMYTVIYNPGANGSGSQQTATKTYGVALTLRGATFTRSGYTQAGWATSDGGAKAYDLGASYTLNAAITLYPYWTADTYTVTYSPGTNGSESQQTATKTHGVALALRGATFTRSGYTQTGWATSDGGAKAYDLGASYTLNAAITLYPYWTADTYTVTFSPGTNGSGSQQTATKTHGVALALRGATFTRSGYTQTGWATSDGGAKAYDLGASYMANAAITLYPYWTDMYDGVQLWEGGPYWATMNIGAEEPWEYGYYFWWGDTVGYTRSGGTWTDGYCYSGVTWVSSTGQQMSSSPFSSSSCLTDGKDVSALLSAGYIDATGNLAPEHDAAHVHWGGRWRMPTDAEFSALKFNCTTTWITTNGVKGRLVRGTGAYANRSIFLPSAGVGSGSSLDFVGSFGYYWSSAPYSGNFDYAWRLYFDSSTSYGSYVDRFGGHSVRPVREFAE